MCVFVRSVRAAGVIWAVGLVWAAAGQPCAVERGARKTRTAPQSMNLPRRRMAFALVTWGMAATYCLGLGLYTDRAESCGTVAGSGWVGG